MHSLTPFRRHSLLGGFDPFREFENLERRFFSGASLPELRIDIREVEEAYILEADLPGYRKEDISIEIEGQYMSVRAERTTDGKSEEERYLRSERSFGAVERTFYLGGVDIDGLVASYENGVLRVKMPKKKAPEREKKTVQIES
ncbi:MAG: Hsp20/alpha crystallin family protein [Clostridia bacterium]|nr:Hsp20/alpha crystallin family protein [Clostridia bacterium]